MAASIFQGLSNLRARFSQTEIPLAAHGTDRTRFPYKEGDIVTLKGRFYVTNAEYPANVEQAKNFARSGFSLHREFTPNQEPIVVLLEPVQGSTIPVQKNLRPGSEHCGPKGLFPWGSDRFATPGTPLRVRAIQPLTPLTDMEQQKLVGIHQAVQDLTDRIVP